MTGYNELAQQFERKYSVFIKMLLVYHQYNLGDKLLL